MLLINSIWYGSNHSGMATGWMTDILGFDCQQGQMGKLCFHILLSVKDLVSAHTASCSVGTIGHLLGGTVRMWR